MKYVGQKELKGIGYIRSFAQFDCSVLIAASAGLFYVDLKAENIQNISRGDFCDVAVRDDQICALDNGSGKIVRFKCDEKTSTFNKQHENASVQISNYNRNQMNTIHVTSEHIHLAEFGAHRIKKYNLTGTLITTVGSKGEGVGQLNGPRLCGSDAHDSVLVTESFNSRLQILNPDDSCQALKCGGLGSPVSAAYAEGSLAVLGHIGGIRVPFCVLFS